MKKLALLFLAQFTVVHTYHLVSYRSEIETNAAMTDVNNRIESLRRREYVPIEREYVSITELFRAQHSYNSSKYLITINTYQLFSDADKIKKLSIKLPFCEETVDDIHFLLVESLVDTTCRIGGVLWATGQFAHIPSSTLMRHIAFNACTTSVTLILSRALSPAITLAQQAYGIEPFDILTNFKRVRPGWLSNLLPIEQKINAAVFATTKSVLNILCEKYIHPVSS